jgi:predicted ArsR family transcriptional regulator
MSPLAQKVLALLRGEDPPATAAAISDTLGVASSQVYVAISQLIKGGVLSQSDIPWRRGLPPSKAGRPKGAVSGLHGIAKAAKYISENAEKDSDKVSALRLLTELQTMGGETAGPPPPGDTEGTIDALERIILAAGPKLLKLAIIRAYPSARVTLDAEEAVDAQAPEASILSPGTPAC